MSKLPSTIRNHIQSNVFVNVCTIWKLMLFNTWLACTQVIITIMNVHTVKLLWKLNFPLIYDCRWSSGVIMYTLLAGSPPFWHRKQMLMLRMILAGNIDFSSPEWEDRSDTVKDLVGCFSPHSTSLSTWIVQVLKLIEWHVTLQKGFHDKSKSNPGCGFFRSLGCWWWTQSSDSQLPTFSTTHSFHSMWWMKYGSSVHTGVSRWDFFMLKNSIQGSTTFTDT